ncbi:hypothetical protein [Streptomyces californicus]
MAQRPVTEPANTIRLGGDGGVLDELRQRARDARVLMGRHQM